MRARPCANGCSTVTVSFTQTPVTLEATPDDIDHVFEDWTGACDTTLTDTCSVALTQPLTTVGVEFRTLDCTPNSEVCDDSTDHYTRCSASGTVALEMDSYFDAKQGSWGRMQKSPLGANVEFELRRHAHGDRDALRRALLTLERQRALIDPVWGGVYQYSSGSTWDEPHYEKLMAYQAARARAYLQDGLTLLAFLDGRSKACVSTFAGLYSATLDRIEAVGFDVFDGAPRLSPLTKLRIVGSALL